MAIITTDKSEQLMSVLRQLRRLGNKLGSEGYPSHVDYISKRDAAAWAARLAIELASLMED